MDAVGSKMRLRTSRETSLGTCHQAGQSLLRTSGPASASGVAQEDLTTTRSAGRASPLDFHTIAIYHFLGTMIRPHRSRERFIECGLIQSNSKGTLVSVREGCRPDKYSSRLLSRPRRFSTGTAGMLSSAAVQKAEVCREVQLMHDPHPLSSVMRRIMRCSPGHESAAKGCPEASNGTVQYSTTCQVATETEQIKPL